MTTLHLVSHTHWDREWYLPFQLFRLKLVRLIDSLLDMMAADPQYRCFTLDGQTIVLDDYLEMRPEREAEIRALVSAGRLFIGPWRVLPDEFLVSPEALVRNLLLGERTARRFGPVMKVGYIPDPFGHIGQMPQILQGFGIDNACLQRGVDHQPCEFWWQAPDGSRVFMAYLREGYGNAALVPMEPAGAFTAEVQRLATRLKAHSAASHLLLMHGTDHTLPSPLTPRRIQDANAELTGAEIVHSNLPAYLAAVREDLHAREGTLPILQGELRSSQRWHLLPGVLSARTWIKQRNHACETLLEKWAEPFSVFAAQVETGRVSVPGNAAISRLSNPAQVLRRAWLLLLENHPHDSICGCSIDQVHEEMRPRFDQVEQIGEEITRQSLETLAEQIDTQPPAACPGAFGAVTVFNPQAFPVQGAVTVELSLPEQPERVRVVDENGHTYPLALGAAATREVGQMIVDREGFAGLLGALHEGRVTNIGPLDGMVLQEAEFTLDETSLRIHLTLTPFGEPDPEAVAHANRQVMQALQNPAVNRFMIQLVTRSTQVRFHAAEVPGLGYRTFWFIELDETLPQAHAQPNELVIENEFLQAKFLPAKGYFTLLDRRSGIEYRTLNRFVDGGDCGDEYNYSPPAVDEVIEDVEVLEAKVERSATGDSLVARLRMHLPAALVGSRDARSPATLPIDILTRAALSPGSTRLDFETEIDNLASDHRLRVHFAAPFEAAYADYDGHFEVVRRPVGVPVSDAAWAEEPRPEQPQRQFCAISQGEAGLMAANRGLREVEVIPVEGGQTELALTLLRCVGWLSRDDFATRQGHAGPALATPGAQMHGKWRFHYALIPFSDGWEAARAEAEAFNTPLRAVYNPPSQGGLPATGSFIQVSPAGFAVTAIKEAEDGQGWIVRGVNLTSQDLMVEVSTGLLGQSYGSVQRVSLAEEPGTTLALDDDGRVVFKARAHEIVTLRFTGRAHLGG